MARIKITDTSQGRTFRTGVNGRFFDLLVNSEIEVEDALVDHLKGLGVAIDELDGSSSKRAGSSEEGSEVGPAPIGEHDVRAPALDAKSLGDNVNGSAAGDQPGDVTASGGVRTSASGGAGPSIEEDAKVSDIRVAAERSAPKDASVAEIAGEGESGTDATKATQPVAPSHVETAAEKKAAKTSKASAKK